MIMASPYLGFRGQAEEALTFYHSVFGGDLRLSRYGDMGITENADRIMHGQLDTGMGWTIMAADDPEGAAPQESRITVCIWGDDEERMTAFFTALAEGGSIEMPLEEQAWGDSFGGLRDRFGIDWGVNIGSPEA